MGCWSQRPQSRVCERANGHGMSRLLAALTPYAVAPARYGPQIRDAGLLSNLGPDWDVIHFSQSIQRTDLPWPPRKIRAGERWTEHRLWDPLSSAWLLGLSKVGGYPGAYADRLLGLLPRRNIRASLARADAVWVAHPYQFSWARRHTPPGTPVAVDAHCVESDLYPRRKARWTAVIAEEISRAELHAWREADVVIATSEEEAARIRTAGAREVVVAPNGVDLVRFRPVSNEAERLGARRRLGVEEHRLLAVFVGSAGGANFSAVEPLRRLASELMPTGVGIVVIGRIGIGRSPSPNLRWVGEVADVVPWLQTADIALCPTEAGSGTSLKVVEYLAAGLPIVSTAIGIRGLDVRDGVEAQVCEIDEFAARIAALAKDENRRRVLGGGARRLAETRYGWPAIGRAVAVTLERLAEGQDNGLADRRRRPVVRDR